jgi:3-oxoadipate enol-lactonase
MPYFDRAGARIHYEDTGGDAPTVVFSHGVLMDSAMFKPQVAALSPRFRCISWDQRGHGQTSFAGSWSYWDSAQDLLGLLDHVGADRALLAGMSQGGFVSLRAALRDPDPVAGLFLIDTQAGTEPPEVLPMYQALAEEWATIGPGKHITDAVAGIILGPADWEPWITKWRERPRETVMQLFETLVSREDLHAELPKISAPAIVVHGREDAAISVEQATALCDGLANCEGLKVIEGAGHASNLSHPDAVNAILLEFAERHLYGNRFRY